MKSLTKSIRTEIGAAVGHVQFSLPVAGVLRDVRSAFFGLCINAGKAVLAAMMEAERTALCGPKGVPDRWRTAYRGGHTKTSVVLGGRRIAISRPRARALEAQELSLPTFEWANQVDPLNAATLSAIAAGVSTRRYAMSLDPLPASQVHSSVSKSSVSRRFVALSAEQLSQWLTRRIEAALPAVMIDGIRFQERVVLVALGFDAQGNKHVLGIWEGSTEKAQVVRALLSDLIERGLSADSPRLWIIDGGKALRRAIVQIFGASALIHRCQEHKRRNVLGHLPEEMHTSVGRAMKDAWESKDALLAKRQLERLANSLAKTHPGAAASLREGLDETITLIGLGIDGALYRTLRTTNPIENLNGLIGHYTRNVKRWRDGQMALRWIATSLNQASRGFRALRGYRDMKRLVIALTQAVMSASDGKLKLA
jgi:transposase-like protein